MSDAYDQLLADIAAGVRLHYDEPGPDPDLALLQGDQHYARGLAQLAELGDLDAVRELADAISLVAAAWAAGEPARAVAVWRTSVARVRRGAGGDGADSQVCR